MQEPNSPFQELKNAAGQPATQPVARMAPAEDNRFRYSNYLVRRQFLKLVGAAFFVDDPSGATVLYANQKAFKLKEDIRLYTGEDKTREVLTIKARSILDLGATYDVWDAATGQKIGALRRSGLKSMLKDEWKIMDVQDHEVGIIEEENMVLALVRRFIDYATFFLPQEYHGKIGNRDVLHFKQRKNPFLMKIEVDFSMDNDGILDRRLGIAAAILMCAVEGKQH